MEIDVRGKDFLKIELVQPEIITQSGLELAITNYLIPFGGIGIMFKAVQTFDSGWIAIPVGLLGATAYAFGLILFGVCVECLWDVYRNQIDETE